MGWRVLSQTLNTITFKEVSPHATSFTWPAELTVSVIYTPQGARVDVTGRNFGFGPVQSGHVQGCVGNFMNRLQVCVRQTQDQTAPVQQSSIAAELERLVRLHQSGALSDSEFAQAKKRLLG